MPKRLAISALITILASAAAWAFGRLQGALTLVLIAACITVIVSWATPLLGVAILDRAILALRTVHWRKEQGRHHAFGGVALHLQEDSRHVWIDGADLQRVLHTHDSPDVLAARHAGHWRRNADGALLLRVDSVIDRLAAGPGRLDPRTVRLRRYFEREVIFPAEERRRRSKRS